MEKESFYSILDEMSTYNFKTYFENSDWYKESLACQVESDPPPQSGNQGSLRKDIISHMDELHKRKLKLFEKKFKSYQELESKEPHLILIQNHPAERYAYLPWINWDKYDPEKHPEEINNLFNEIKGKKFQEIFYQPIPSEFLKKLEKLIKNKINEEEPEIKKEEEINKDTEKIEEKENPLWMTALDIYYTLNIYQGNYKKISEFHNYMKNESNQVLKYNNYLENHFSFVDSNLKVILNKIFLLENNYKPYPIMQNWAITDIFNMTKNLFNSDVY